ncbi:MAG: CPBP family intramembrane metalloprotease [Candidatus Krumholzibacteriota bacterium]|nr:CPBP family intramembrane metalloprotease [Candidatus Krumholzibacteriota bacterium]
MSRLSHWIASRPVIAFFAITYLLSWPLFFVVFRVLPQSMAAQGTLGSLAVFAPAVAAMIVAAVAEPARLPRQRAAHWATFAVAWLLAWATLVLFAARVRGAPVGPPLVVFGAILALLPAFTASRAFSRVAGVRRHFRTLAAPRGNAVWYLVALLAFPAVQLAGAGLTRLLGGEGGAAAGPGIAVDPAVAALILLNGFFFAGGINEESGWRGFALPRLQRRLCPLVAGLVVWVFWALWHLPADLASGDPASAILVNRVFLNAMWSVLFMWVYNRTGGSLLAPALFHPAMNASGELLPRTDVATALFVVLVLAAIVSDRMWRRLPETHGAVAG